MALAAPKPLAAHHKIGDFASGIASLDGWLKRRAFANQLSGASRTFVVGGDAKVIGYYALAAGGVNIGATPGRFRRNMPEPVPVAVLGRLAVDHTYQGRGLGRAMFRDAAQRVIQAADAIGIRGILVHAISEEAKSFYVALGLVASPIDPMVLMITLADVQMSLK